MIQDSELCGFLLCLTAVTFLIRLEQIRTTEKYFAGLNSRCRKGRVAQLVRALLSHSRGPGFESLRDHAPLSRSIAGHFFKLPIIR